MSNATKQALKHGQQDLKSRMKTEQMWPVLRYAMPNQSQHCMYALSQEGSAAICPQHMTVVNAAHGSRFADLRTI